MSATTTPWAPVTVTSAPKSRASKVSRYELSTALSEADRWPKAIDALYEGHPDREDHPAVDAWENMRQEVIEEIAPKVARLYDEALQRRLPWTWNEGEDR